MGAPCRSILYALAVLLVRAVVGVWTDSAGRDLLGDLGDMWVGPSHPGAPRKVTGGGFVAAPPAR